MGSDPLLPFDARKPNIARAYDYLLGGKDNFAADRELAAKMLEIYPLAGVLARENRRFLALAVDYVSRQGTAQFIDVGSGLPTSPNTHEVACRVNPAARVVYVDNDPVVISHATALLVGSGSVAAVPGDVRYPDAILASAGAVIDLSQPACVILAMILHFFDPAEAAGIVAGFVRALAPGSFLVISVGVNRDAGLADQVRAEYSAGGLHVHDRGQIAGYFTGLELAGPGLTEARNWLRAHDQSAVPYQGAVPSRPADVLAGIGRKTA
jgi:O-methyltransferase involved in polyketide biosynthesis